VTYATSAVEFRVTWDLTIGLALYVSSPFFAIAQLAVVSLFSNGQDIATPQALMEIKHAIRRSMD
jgi:hypothetical protein